MRAPVQKTRTRRKGRKTGPDGQLTPGLTPDTEPTGRGRPAHVRNRLIIAVAVVAAAIAGAGAPTVLAASAQLHDAQNLVTLAEQTQHALTLAHSLADERDEVTVYVAQGRPKGKGPSEQRSSRVDRQIEELRTDAPAELRRELDAIAAVRRASLTGKSSALEAHQEYSGTIAELHALAERLAEQLPPRAGGGAHALADLDLAVQQAAAARGLLLAALAVPTRTTTTIDPITGLPETTTGSSPSDTRQRAALSAAAQQAHVREEAALADFRDAAPKATRGAYDSTVTGPDVVQAEKYLKRLTDQPTLSADELDTNADRLDRTLSARIDLMRGAESALNDRRTKDLEKLRDDDVTALEIRIALIGVILLVAVGFAMAVARTLTRPLAVLRLGSARLAGEPGTGEPIRFNGRDDEFAQVVRSVNALHAHTVALQERLATLEGDRKHLVGQRQKMADDREGLRAQLADATAQLERMRAGIHGTFVNLALRTLGLVERQLGVIEGLEQREQDPDRLATLFKLDHFATVMRRHSENLLVLAGADHGHQHPGPVPLVDVVRAAVSEIERYERVRIAALPPHAHIAGFAADDLSHLLAELMENATSFSPPDIPVEVSGWLLESGEVMLSVQDEGIGTSSERLAQLNLRLGQFNPDEPYDHSGGDGLGLGLYVVARIAHRHGVRVRLRDQKQGGIAAVVVLPKTLLSAAPPAAVVAPVDGGAPSLSLPGADAEANSNRLDGRSPGTVDPLIAAAERAARPDVPAEALDGVPADALDGGRGAGQAPAQAEAQAQTPAPEETPGGGGPDEPLPAETTMELLAPIPAADEPAEPTAAEVTQPAAGEPTEPTEPEYRAASPADPYAIGPDAHARTPDEADEARAPRTTDKGLPKRTPRISPQVRMPTARAGGVDAEALRRRLSGFHQGAAAGHRDVEAEIAERMGEQAEPGPATGEAAGGPRERTGEVKGDTVEEARS
ncbi:nitrate- and nitrite sensing domain-containing protein [Streptomyces cavernae]|uniref:sensor histidine kinase n=1 Tax=Streptomyces cavernae TaxID=2259034 RepID=UPI000FEB6172|nr:nitrate- and nitrite sensing domain-containing protein [Streptomyces cavernae]